MAHVLVVDDELMIRFLVRSVLELAGHEVLEAEDGRKAFDMLEMYPTLIDIIVLDMQMPHMGGIEFLSILHPETVYPPIIILTAHKKFMQNELVRKVSGHLSKPFRTRDLVDMVNTRHRIHRGQTLT